MKKQYVLVVFFVLFFGVQMSVAPGTNNTTMTNIVSPAKTLGKLSSTTVTTVSTLTLSDSVITTYATSGTGTATDPYVVSNYVITNGKTSNGLIINGLTKYVILQNFTIHDTSNYGIVIYGSSAHVTFNDTTAYNNVWGLYVESGSHITVTNGNFSYNSYGVTAYGSLGYNVISGNVFHNNTYGVYLYAASEDTITNNHVYYNSIGIVVSSSNSNYVSNNDVYSNPIGIEIHSGNYNYLTNNTVSQSSEYGFHVFLGSNYNNIDQNTISTSSINNILVNESSYNNITANTFVSSTQAHINIGNQSVSNTIDNNAFTNAPVGVNDNGSSNLLVSSNSFNGVLDGVVAANTNAVTVFNNSYTVNGWSTGTETAVTFTNVNGFNILTNDFYNSYNGLVITSSSNGNISYNSFTRMYSYTFNLVSSSNITLSRNYFANEYYSVLESSSATNILFEYNYINRGSNTDQFFWALQSSTITFKHNVFVLNAYQWAYFYYPTQLTFEQNSFYGVLSFSQVSLSSTATVNFTLNYYNTYLGTDTNNDGIGDSPFTVYSGIVDNYPLMASPALQINVTSTKTIVQKSASDKVSFTLDSFFNGTYTLEVNSVVQLNGSTIQAQPLSLSATIPNSKVTSVNVTITLTDQYHLTRVLTTMVEVVPASGPVITGPSTYTYNGSNLLPEWNVSDMFLQSVQIVVNGSTVYSANISSSETFVLPQTLSLQPGTYNVKVIATDTYSNTVEFTTTLTVVNSSTSGTSGATVTVTETVTGSSNATSTSSASTSSSTKSSPGFELIFTVLGLVAIVIMGKRRFK